MLKQKQPMPSIHDSEFFGFPDKIWQELKTLLFDEDINLQTLM